MYKQKTLSNGIKLITAPIKGTKTATVLVMVATGSKYENRRNSGISHFLEHMFFKGTKKRPTTMDISSELDGIGSDNNAFTSKEYTGYWVKANTEKLEVAIDVLSDMLINSKFAPQEIERERGVIIEELNMYQDNPMAYIDDLFEQCLYEDTPAGWDVIGTKETISSVKRADFIEYVKSQYGAENITISVAGNFNEKKLIEMIEKYFSSISPAKVRGKEQVTEKQAQPVIKLRYKKTDQAHLMLGVRAFPFEHKDKIVEKLLAVILGGSMSSRLFIQLRERRGLAYYVRSHAEFYTDTGYFATQAGVPVAKVEEALKVILEEYKRMTKTLVKEEELKRVKDLIKGKVAISLEASDNVAEWYARQSIMDLTLEREKGEIRSKKKKVLSPEEYLKEIEKVKAEDIRRVAREIFVNQGLNLAVIGPYKDDKSFKGILGLTPDPSPLIF